MGAASLVRPGRSASIAWWAAVCALLSDCTCGGKYPKTAQGAELQQNALSMRVAADTLNFARNNIESILRQKFDIDAQGYMTIYLPEATDSSGERLCDEQGTYAYHVPDCDYSLRVRDGCLGPGEPGMNGACPPVRIGADHVTITGRETHRSFMRVKVDDLAAKLQFEMEPAGSTTTGGIRLRITDLDVDLDLGLYAKLPQFLGMQLGDFTCRYHKQNDSLAAVTIKSLDVSMQPRVETVNGKPSLFATTVARQIDIGNFNLTATELTSDLACTTAATGQGALGCSASCAAVGVLLEGTSTVLNTVMTVLAPVLPYIITPIGNLLLSFLWGDVLEFELTLPTANMAWVPKGVGTNVQVLANAQDGAFAVNQLGAGPVDPTMGMSLPFAMGAYAERSPCVAPSLPPPINTSVLPPKLDGVIALPNPNDPTQTIDETYHFGLMLSESYLNAVAWALRSSGLLCAALGSDPGGLLSTGNFVPTAGLLYLLAPPISKMAPPSAPIFLRTIPGTTNTLVRFGSGKEIGKDANGKPIKESLITLGLLDMGIEFHLFAWNRFVRAFGLQVDLIVGLSVHAASDGKVTVSIDNIQADNVRDFYNDLMPGYDFSRITEVLFSVLSSQLNGGLLTFEVPLQQLLKTALGGAATARVLDVKADGSGNAFLTAFVKLCTPTDESDPQNHGCYVPPPTPAAREGVVFTAHQVASAEGYLAPNDPDLDAVRARGVPRGVVTVALDHRAAGQWEYQYAVDSDVYGRFTAPAPDGLLRLEHPLLRMLGHHRVAIRARQIGRPVDLAGPVATTEVLVDPERPRVVLARAGDYRTLTSEDLVTPPERMQFAVFEPSAESADRDRAVWIGRQEAERLLNTLSAQAIVLARDEAGNVSDDGPFLSRIQQKRQNCQQSGLPCLLAVGFAMCLRRRKKLVRTRTCR